MTQLKTDTLTSHQVYAQYSQQQFYRGHLEISSKNLVYVYPTMTILRCPKALYGASAVYLKRGELFLFGGIEPVKNGDSPVERKYQNTTYIYYNSFAPNRIQKGHYMEMGKWTAIEEPKNDSSEENQNNEQIEQEDDLIFPSERAFSTAQYIPQSKVYVYGGEDENKQPLSDVWCFDLVKKCWYIVGDGPIPLSLSASIVHYSTKYQDEHKAAHFLKSKCNEDETLEEEHLSRVLNDYQSFLKDPYALRFLPDAPNVDSNASYYFIIYGGKTIGGKCVDRVYAYSISSKTWTELPKGPPARRGHSLVYKHGKMYIYGGFSDNKVFNSDIWEYDIQKAMNKEEDYLKQLEPQSTRNPEGRTGHSALLIGSQMIIFGGHNGTTTKNDMWAFDLDTLQWKELKITKSIHGRWYQSLTFVNDNQFTLIGGANSAMTKAIQNVELFHLPLTDIDIHISRIDEKEEIEGESSDLDEYDDLLDDPELDNL